MPELAAVGPLRRVTPYPDKVVSESRSEEIKDQKKEMKGQLLLGGSSLYDICLGTIRRIHSQPAIWTSSAQYVDTIV